MKVNYTYLILYNNILSLLVIPITTHSSIPSDSTIYKNSSAFSKPDSQMVKSKVSKAPIIAFGLVGAAVGGAIGEAIDPQKRSLRVNLF